ncbi:MAG: hypothetical protein H0T52_11825 [Lautropia sp.]|nr:hypothetical protein [Lautropia sp.]
MKRIMIAPLAVGALAAGLLVPPSSNAQQKETFSVSGTLSGSLTLTTDYRFRGVSQTFGDPALQGGVDFSLPSNFYIGTWASVVDKEIFANTRGFEVDIYGGYKRQLGGGMMLDVGLLQYLYPTESLYSTLEAYAGVSYGWLSFKYSHSLSNRFFGVMSARGSQYYDLTAIYPLGNGLNAIGHYGIQRIHDNGGDYTDWRLGVSKDWRGFTWAGSYFDTDSTFNFTNRAGRTRDLGEGGLVLSVSKTF